MEYQMKPTLLVASLISLFAGAAAAETYNVGTIDIVNPWTRATPKGAEVAGAYMTIRNKGKASDRLIGGSSAVADRLEVHQAITERGVAKMRPVEGGLEIKPGQTVDLKPGSFHVMLTGLKLPLEKGQRVKATLEFEKAGKVDIEYAVETVGATAGPAGPKGKTDHGVHSGH
jgi:periplasmic copper chaperone A